MPEPAADLLLRENLERLASVDPQLAASVRGAVADPRILSLPSRSGPLVPAVRAHGGTAPLHSLYDPRAEARRLVHSAGAEGFLVLFGLGGGFLAEAALENPGTWHVVVVEKDAGVLRALMACAPLARVLGDPRVSVVCGTGSIRGAILSRWKPALMGGMRVLSLRPWYEQERTHFDAAASFVQSAVEAVRADYSVQAHFGKRWFANMVANLPYVGSAPPARPRAQAPAAAVITAAGPSLDEHAAELAARGGDVMLLATDTSLPALSGRAIVPDAVLSIDCQVYGYHHFLQGLPAGTELYLDLASPPLLSRRFPRARFVAGAHPLARYIDSHWMRLPFVDTSGGNVTHAAVTLAFALGARDITVRGADFSYPDAKPYARGTYLYDLFQTGQDRFCPAHSALVSMAVANAERENRGGKSVYTTPLMAAYRSRFEELMAGIRSQQQGWLEAPGGGEVSEVAGVPSVPPAPVEGWREFLAGYAGLLESLPPARGALDAAARADLGTGELWATLLPIAARVVRDGTPPGPAALEEARRWAIQRSLRTVASGDAGGAGGGT